MEEFEQRLLIQQETVSFSLSFDQIQPHINDTNQKIFFSVVLI